MSGNTFTHQPLKDAEREIRLLRFSNDPQQSGRIACDLTAFDISSCPSYAAISYTWGSPDDSHHKITINGKDFDVWHNCHYALNQIAPHLQIGLRYFWLDSICINQDDLDEKALQVAMMADIYIRTQTVLSCVGPHADDSEIVLPMVKHMAKWIRSQPREERYKQPVAMGGLIEYHRANEIYGSDTGSRSNAAYIAFGNREYWQRMWIVQEARLAKKCTIFCGSDSIDLADFATLLRAFMNDEAADKDFFPSFWLMTNMWRTISGSSHLPKRAEADGNVRPLAISKALERFDRHKASNFRDQLYALAKVAEWPDGAAPPKPDYRITKLTLLKEVLQRLSGVNWAAHKCCTALARLTTAFDVTIHDPEVQDLLQQRAQAIQTPRNITTFLYAGVYQRRPAGCRIRALPNGALTGNIQNANKGRVLFEEEKSRIWYSQTGRPLYVDHEIAGYLTPQSRPGDVLLQIDDGNGLPIWLVIGTDQSDKEKFNIIGPALANPGFGVQSSERSGYTDMYDHSQIPEDRRNAPSMFDLWFDQEDFLVWRAWFHSFEKKDLSKQEVEDFLAGKNVDLSRSWAVLKEEGADWRS